MSKLLNRSCIADKKIFYSLQRIHYNQHFIRNNSTNFGSNQLLIQDLITYVKQNIIEPQSREISTRPRYKSLSNNEDINVDDVISSTSSTITHWAPSDFTLSKVLPVNAAQNAVDCLHDYMPYYGAVILVPFLVKFMLTIPLTVFAQRSQEKFMPLIPIAMKEYKQIANEAGGDKKKFLELKNGVIAKYGFNPMTVQFRPLILALVQAPVHITFFIAFRTMYSSFPDWKYGGIYWFPDLSVPDQYWILPISVGCCMGLSFWNTIRYQKDNQMMYPGVTPEMMNIIFGSMAVMMIPMSHFWSAGFNLYMSANILSYMMQFSLLQDNDFRTSVGLRRTSFTTQYQHELRKINQDANQAMEKNTIDENVNK